MEFLFAIVGRLLFFLLVFVVLPAVLSRVVAILTDRRVMKGQLWLLSWVGTGVVVVFLMGWWPEKREPKPEPKPITKRAAQPASTLTKLGDRAEVKVPAGWREMGWELPNLQLAVGDSARGEFVTIHAREHNVEQPFASFQAMALRRVRADLIDGGEAGAATKQFIRGREVVSRGLSGRSRLAEQNGEPMALRVSCVNGKRFDFYIVQWRNAAWDAQSVASFDRLLRSFQELRDPAERKFDPSTGRMFSTVISE